MIGFARVLHYVSIVLTLVIGLSWVMFAVDQVGDASDGQTKKISESGPVSGDTTEQTPAPASEDKGAVRSAIDDGADALTSPFDGIVADDANVWARETVPAILGVLLYGVGLAVLGRWILTRA